MAQAWSVVLAVLASAAVASAQTAAVDSGGAPPAPRPRPIEVGSLFSIGAELGGPYKVTGSLRHDLMLARSGSDDVLVLQSIVSVGSGGNKVGFGVGYLGLETSLPIVRATLARTHGDPLGALPRRDWVGAEMEWSFAHLLSAQAGILAPMGGGDIAFTWSVGIGLPLIDPNNLPCPGCH